MFLIDVKEGTEFELSLYVVSATEKKDRTGRSYVTGEIKDKSLNVKYNLWDSSNVSCKLPKAGMYATIKGRMESYNNKKQVTVNVVKPLSKDAIDPKNFKKTSIKDIDVLWQECVAIVETFKDPLVRYIADSLIRDEVIAKEIKAAPAAQNVHNAWVGGLLEHSLAIASLCDNAVVYYNTHYYEDKLDRDIAVFGALFHDMGKIWEYDHTSPDVKNTFEGELMGHIYMGAHKIGTLSEQYVKQHPEVSRKEIDLITSQLVHIILSHHGKLDWGAPINPKTPEAILVHYLDNLDTKMMNAWENITACKEDFTDRIFIQENVRLFNTFKYR